MRLIDADEAIINFGFEWDDICPTRDEVVSFLRKQKTIDAVPVVRGEWIAEQKGAEYCEFGVLRATDPLDKQTSLMKRK